MTNKILIFSATFNEAENIEEFLSTIEHLNLNLDILIIDDYSPDGTWKIIENYSKNKKNIKLIVRNKKEGLDTAHKTAFEYAIDNNYEFLITLDADLSHDPKKIPEFINELKRLFFATITKPKRHPVVPKYLLKEKTSIVFFGHVSIKELYCFTKGA